jgi:hypothetical protein
MSGAMEILFKNLLIKYYEGLIDSCFKLIPLSRGEKYKSREIIYTPEESYRNYKSYIDDLIIEICGNSMFFCSANSIKLASILKGMADKITICDLSRVKNLTRNCIDLCKKIINEIEVGDS